jgi:hypothetical protein
MIKLNDQLKISILVLLVGSYIIYDQKPRLMFKENGEFKHFGVKQDETIFPFFMMITVMGFTVYYVLLLREGKYV